ncbi:hypothetical protein PsorP6_017970 [Peronosclerospora sorghi]|uniref:Uncharacterized protein n=1 Tax=Peronosclerospora sorghi TaxID=230839 RepID=A0ACC0WC16_9STRA|nr:hypothetical protein PsorP6_017970 [Peronosclerospora sorghi]
MNRALETVFPTFLAILRPAAIILIQSSFIILHVKAGFLQVEFCLYKGHETIEDGRVILFFGPGSDPEPRFDAFDLETPRLLFANDDKNMQMGDSIECEITAFTTPETLSIDSPCYRYLPELIHGNTRTIPTPIHEWEMSTAYRSE